MTKMAEISDQMTLGKATVDKLEDIEDDDKRVEAVGKLTNPRMEVMLVMCGNTVIVHKSKETLGLDCIVVLNTSGVLKNGAVV